MAPRSLALRERYPLDLNASIDDAGPGPEPLDQPEVALHMIRDCGNEILRGAPGQSREDHEHVGEVAVHCRSGLEIGVESVRDETSDRLRGASSASRLVGSNIH